MFAGILILSAFWFVLGMMAFMGGAMSDSVVLGAKSSLYGLVMMLSAVAAVVLDFVAKHLHWL